MPYRNKVLQPWSSLCVPLLYPIAVNQGFDLQKSDHDSDFFSQTIRYNKAEKGKNTREMEKITLSKKRY